jgi:hypothetical protein
MAFNSDIERYQVNERAEQKERCFIKGLHK